MANESTVGRTFKTLAWQLLAGLVLGVLFWELFGQRLLSMKYGSIGSSVTCAPDVRNALADFDSGLRRSAAIGAAALVVLIFFWKRWWRKRGRASANPPGASSGPTTPPSGSAP